jgi:antitoxin YefM
MIAVSLKKFKQEVETFLAQSEKDHEPIFVKRKTDGFVVLRLEDYNSLIETLHLLRNEANANWLKESIRQADSGELIPIEQIYEKFGTDFQRA